ncbi:N-acetylneuraminate synthase [Solitalea canadensis]|uniref:N-acetylneuraminate synthase n=1 Tax=Solitalea canadensis (strain ATCC 29591 / DSM 3403 / JCM 21819 / LMG 8368 / NBRC 15130 / NCIMB 12057 / USAM 9D) TaxID=929556 RepID=H8KMB5_SOLCM|nr:N-acetylneuraminate synthase [Solitalea canadensis]AFD09297.1 N-acetylneuraminate synthase [Solitalea canadensis DSM 3403]
MSINKSKNRVLIIAEAGVNHNGDINLAKKLIDVAADAGVDYVKFQTFKAEKLVSKSAKKAEYQERNIGDGDDFQFTMLKKLELDENTHRLLIDYCNSKGVKFLSTAFDLDSIDLLSDLGVDLFKVPSGEITNYQYLKKIGSTGKPIIVSTGMSDLNEIKDAVALLKESGTNESNITVLHCNTEYPTPMRDVNLLAMNTIANELSVPVGYSDHTLGIEVPIAAVALGAICIEKHFTLDRSMPGPDHKASLEPVELKAMVSAIRNIEMALGDGTKQASASESKNKDVARKSIHLLRDLPSGHILVESDLIMKRPGNGISPMELPSIIGLKLKRSLHEDSMLNWDDLEKL